ncbi:MAG: nickel-dependent hydrogenase large subunit, partial [Acidobacteria bacterium]|nr:nickel-dependent hydrogenase large subunit [Acidobacteriota bacterium]
VEDALDITVPPNAELIRNLMFCAQYMQDHVVHFYHLHALDWVDVISALKADPQRTSELAQSISDWPLSSASYFSGVQKRLRTFVDSGQLGIFANGYWGHAAYRPPPEFNLLATAHYLEALSWQKEVVKVHSIFGGKNPHPDYLVGGVPCAINLDEANALNAERLAYVGALLDEARAFVEQVYLPDLMALASLYRDWAAIGGGLTNYLAYGDLPTRGYGDPSSFKFPRGIILDRNLDEVLPVDGRDAGQVQEEVARSWYEYSDGDGGAKHPWDGETRLRYAGPRPPYEHLQVQGKYSWLKTPRWRGYPMEVGPLARILVAYASGSTEVRELVDGALKQLDVPMQALYSTLGRTAARALETKLVARWAREFYDELLGNIRGGELRTFHNDRWDPETWPREAKGVGLSEAPRGALAHWIVIKDQKIENYQLVVPSTWNASPRDGRGQMSAYEAALIGTPVADPERPLEVLRTIHSFDPCIACAVHLYDEEGRALHRFTTF